MVIIDMDSRCIPAGWCYNWSFSADMGNTNKTEIGGIYGGNR